MIKAAAMLGVIGVGVFCFLGPARADGVAGYVQPQPSAPVQISSCTAGVQFISNGWGTAFSRLNTGAEFRNISPKVAVAVLIHLQLSNAFGAVMDNRFGQATGQFAPDAVIRGNHWSETDTWPGLSVVRCSVSRVLFSDGSVWAEPKSQESPSPYPNT
jgi:hypothetical protein